MSSTEADIDYQRQTYDYAPCAEQRADHVAADPHPVVVVGAGPVGLATAIDLARHDVPVVLVDDDCALSTGSRAICFAKRTLDIFDRLGCGDRMVDKGVRWHLGKVFMRDRQVYAFDLLPNRVISVPPLSICSSTTSRAICSMWRAACPISRSAGKAAPWPCSNMPIMSR